MRPGCAQCGQRKDATVHEGVEYISMNGRTWRGFENGRHPFKPRTALNELDEQIANVCRLGRGEKVPRLNKDGTVMSEQMDAAEPTRIDALVEDLGHVRVDQIRKKIVRRSDNVSAHRPF